MFIEGLHGDHWNLDLCVNYRRDDKGVFHLVFPVDGGRLKVAPDHPRYSAVAEHLRERTPA